MGVVYLATHTGLDRKVALDFLTPDYADDEAFRDALPAGVQATLPRSTTPTSSRSTKPAQIDGHLLPGDATMWGDRPPTAPICRGVALDSRPHHPRSWPKWPQRLARPQQPVSSTATSSPGNVLLARGARRSDGSDHVYLTDFGLDQAAWQPHQLIFAQIGGFVGTLDYIAPEQIEGNAVDGSAD